MTSTISRRLAALEVQRRPSTSYVVWLPPEALGTPDAKHAAIMEHRRRTGWTEAVILAPLEMTVGEWIAEYGCA